MKALFQKAIVAAGAFTVAALGWPTSNRLPPMGWNSWNFSEYGDTQYSWDENYHKAVVDSFVSKGLRDAGYVYISIKGSQMTRDASGGIVFPSAKFPSGIRGLTSYFHDRGMKAITYTDGGTTTCHGGATAGCYSYWQRDADSLAAWGIDGVKEDWCSGAANGLTPRIEYPKFCQALANTGRDFTLEICCWGVDNPWEWGTDAGTYWRTGPDIDCGSLGGLRVIGSTWTYIMNGIDQNNHPACAGPGKGWNYADMLEVGVPGGLNELEEKTMFAMWCIMASPLILGCDIFKITQPTLDIVTNPEAIAVNQDSAGIQGTIVATTGTGLEVWCKPLAQFQSCAVALLNRTESTAPITVNWSDIGLPSENAVVHDVWQRSDIGIFTDSYMADVAPHEAAFIKISTGSSVIAQRPIATRQIQHAAIASDKVYNAAGRAISVNKAGRAIGVHVVRKSSASLCNLQLVINLK